MTTVRKEIAKADAELLKNAKVIANILKLSGITVSVEPGYCEYCYCNSVNLIFDSDNIQDNMKKSLKQLRKVGFSKEATGDADILWLTRGNRGLLVYAPEDYCIYVVKALTEPSMEIILDQVVEKLKIDLVPDKLDKDSRFTKICTGLYTVEYCGIPIYFTFEFAGKRVTKVCVDTRPRL